MKIKYRFAERKLNRNNVSMDCHHVLVLIIKNPGERAPRLPKIFPAEHNIKSYQIIKKRNENKQDIKIVDD